MPKRSIEIHHSGYIDHSTLYTGRYFLIFSFPPHPLVLGEVEIHVHNGSSVEEVPSLQGVRSGHFAVGIGTGGDLGGRCRFIRASFEQAHDEVHNEKSPEYALQHFEPALLRLLGLSPSSICSTSAVSRYSTVRHGIFIYR